MNEDLLDRQEWMALLDLKDQLDQLANMESPEYRVRWVLLDHRVPMENLEEMVSQVMREWPEKSVHPAHQDHLVSLGLKAPWV